MSHLESTPDPNPYASSWLLPPSVPFDDYCNQRQTRHIFVAMATFIFIPWALTAVALHFRFWNGQWTNPQAFVVLFLSFSCTVAVQLLLANFIYTYGPDVVQLLRGRFQAEGIDPDAWDGICITFTPADRPRQFKKGSGTHPVFDAGFVFLFYDDLMFLGEKTSFVLPRDSVRSIRLGNSSREIGWHPKRIYIDWFDARSQSVQTFNFGVTGGRSQFDCRTRVVPELLERIQSWQQGLSHRLKGSPNMGSIPPPDPSLAAKAIPHAEMRHLTLTGLMYLSFFAGLVEAGVAWGIGIPFTGCVPITCLLSTSFLCSPELLSAGRPA